MNLKEMSVTELKALVYDQSVIVENAQGNIRTVNAEIASRIVPEKQPEATPA